MGDDGQGKIFDVAKNCCSLVAAQYRWHSFTSCPIGQLCICFFLDFFLLLAVLTMRTGPPAQDQ